ncbi:hypothetical protein GOP47_0029448 [Adiantum capillus-veneris]|nr:hypothetical protein GOP47_0029448 [Adiantum capillus-veneris]
MNHWSGNEGPPGPSWTLLQRGSPSSPTMVSSSLAPTATNNPSVDMIDSVAFPVHAITRKGKEKVVEEERDPRPTCVVVLVPDPLAQPRCVHSHPTPSKLFPPILSFDLVAALN